MTQLVICGHGQGKTGYDVGAVNRSLNITEAQKVRELASLMKQHATKTHFITDKNVYDFRNIASISKGYESVTELHFNSFNGQAQGTEVLIKEGFTPDSLDTGLKNVLEKYFKARGFKFVDWLYNANVMSNTGISYRLIEVCFIDNNNDMAIFEKNKNSIARELVEAIEGRKIVEKPKPTPKPTAKPTPKAKASGNALGIEQLATDTVNGKYGNGEERKKKLGKLYDSVQIVINERFKSISASESHRLLAKEVLKGNLGNGEERKKNLGSYYNSVQALINSDQVK